ncbi:MAG: DUF4760 domain-containing protein [Bryobacteraceae bacterium]
MSIYEEANLILKLYELRREPVMRAARDWYAVEFHPQSVEEFNETMYGEHSAHLRMVLSYWEMAAALANRGAISLDLFAETQGECIGAFAKMEPVLADIRKAFGPEFLASLEKLIDSIPDGRARAAQTREFMKGVREQVNKRQQAKVTSATT